MATAPSTSPFFPAPYTPPAPASPSYHYAAAYPPPLPGFVTAPAYAFPPPSPYSYDYPHPAAAYPAPPPGFFPGPPNLVSFPTSCYHPPLPNSPNWPSPAPDFSTSLVGAPVLGSFAAPAYGPSGSFPAAAIHSTAIPPAPTREQPQAHPDPTPTIPTTASASKMQQVPAPLLERQDSEVNAFQRHATGLCLDRVTSSTTTNKDNAAVLAQSPLRSVPEVTSSTPRNDCAFETEEDGNATARSVCTLQIKQTGSDAHPVLPDYTRQVRNLTKGNSTSSSVVQDILGELSKISTLVSQYAVAMGWQTSEALVTDSSSPAASAQFRSPAITASRLADTGAAARLSASSGSSPFGASRTEYVAAQVFDKMPTPCSLHGPHIIAPGYWNNCSGHQTPIQSTSVPGGNSNLSEQNIDGTPQSYGFHHLKIECVFRADGTEHRYYALPETYPLAQATPEPVVDVPDDDTDGCSIDLVDLFAGTPQQQLHADTESNKSLQELVREHLPKCFSKAPENEQTNAYLNYISDVSDYTPEQLTYEEEKQESEQLDKCLHKASATASYDQVAIWKHPCDLDINIGCPKCFSKPIFSPERPTVGIDSVFSLQNEELIFDSEKLNDSDNQFSAKQNIEQLLNCSNKASQCRTCDEESQGVEKILWEHCQTATRRSILSFPWDPGASVPLMSSKLQHSSKALQCATHGTILAGSSVRRFSGCKCLPFWVQNIYVLGISEIGTQAYISWDPGILNILDMMLDKYTMPNNVQFIQWTAELLCLNLTTCTHYMAPNGINSILHHTPFILQRAAFLSQGNYFCSLYCNSVLKTEYCKMRCFWEFAINLATELYWDPEVTVTLHSYTVTHPVVTHISRSQWQPLWIGFNVSMWWNSSLEQTACLHWDPGPEIHWYEILWFAMCFDMASDNGFSEQSQVLKHPTDPELHTDWSLKITIGNYVTEHSYGDSLFAIQPTQLPQIHTQQCHTMLITEGIQDWDPGIRTPSSIHLLLQGLTARIATKKPLSWLPIPELTKWQSQTTSISFVWDPGTMFPWYKYKWWLLFKCSGVTLWLIHFRPP